MRASKMNRVFNETFSELYPGNGSARTESPKVNITIGNSRVSGGPSHSTPIEFLIIVICIGVIGMVANVAVLWALVSNQRKGNTNTLNQTVADFYSCTLLIISYALKIPEIYLTGVWGSLLCSFIIIDSLVWVGLIASITSLVILTLERYFKIVHPVLHRKKFRPWIIKAAVIVTWGNGILRNIQLGLAARVVAGKCSDGGFFHPFEAQMAYATVIFFWDFVIPLIVFFYCYGRILTVVRSTMGAVANTPNTLPNTAARDNAARTQGNVVRTLILVSATFIVCWTPCAINRLLLYSRTIKFTESYYVILAVAFLNTAVNPLIYAAKYQPVRKSLLGLIGFRNQGPSVAPMTAVDDTINTRSVAHI